MAVDGISPALAIRSSVGVELWSSAGLKSPYVPNPQFTRDETKFCRAISFSKCGRYFAWANGSIVRIVNTTDWKEICFMPRPKAFHLKFSPRGNYLVTWELFTINKDNPEGSPNMYVYKCENGEQVFSTIQKKQIDWEPCWSADETIFGLMIGGEAIFYEINSTEGFKSSSNKLGGGRNGLLSIGPGNSPPYMAFYVPGTKGAPSMCKIYKYPALQQNQNVTCKSLYQADHVEMLWNKRGTGLLLLTSTDVDQSGASYYGKQALNFMSTKGDSFAVQLGKTGPIHSVTWSPKATEFCVVYGYMPAKATLFNLKCDSVFDFGEGARNSSYFNDFGNLLILAGFGNLQGYVEIWDMINKVQIAKLTAPDTTLLEWCPDGETFLTATTAPRLRIGNGFKIWHYSGALLYETMWPKEQELLEVLWQKYSEGTLTEKPISNEKIEGIKSSQPEPSKQVYQPPNVRLMKEGKLGTNGESALSSPIPGLPPGYTSQKNTSNSNRQRKARNRPNKDPGSNAANRANPKNFNQQQTTNESQRNQQQTNAANNTDVPADEPSASDKIDNNKPQNKLLYQGQSFNKPKRSRSDRHFAQTGDPEKDKKIRAIGRKLQDITKLKSKQFRGEQLEANQLTKIAGEAALIEELKSLKM